MIKKASREEIIEIKEIAEKKLDLLKGKMSEEDYLFLLKESMKEIAIDFGLEIHNFDFENISS